MNFDYDHPDTSLRFGRGRRNEIGEITSEYGDTAAVVTTRTAMQEAGFLDDVEESLDEAGVEYLVYNYVQPNPTVENVENGIRELWDNDVDVVVAMGGGSVMDTAKTMALGLASLDSPDESIWGYCTGEEEIEEALPIVAVPTTSGTGSHIDPWAVISNEEADAKPGFGGDPLIPKAAVVDPDIPGEMPPKLTARTGFDALCHLNEAYVAEGASGMSDVFAEKGIEKVGDYLRDAVDDDTEAREEMAVADTLAGICETTSMVIVTHALAHSVSALHPDVAHGDALAALTSEVARFNVENGDKETKKRYSKIAELLGVEIADPVLDAIYVVDAFEELKKDIGLNVTLEDLGVEEDEIEELADNSEEYMEMAIETNPVELDHDDLVEILEESY
ncbi:iron-containing alcohol dehydrogenase [Halorutilales archaeon Cl-col2-1]